MATKRLAVELQAKTDQFDSKVRKSKGALDQLGASAKKAGGDTDGLGSKSEGASGKLGNLVAVARGAALAIGGFAAAILGAAAALNAYASVQGRAIRETETLARMAGVSTKEFKSLAFAYGTVGISAEQVGDIFKDTQERIGDFLATGGGPLQDFFDVMAIGKEEAHSFALEMQKLSGPEVLQAMTNRMEAAGKSTQQISFALEGMASDATKLIPLLKDSGKAAKDLQDRFDEIDSPLSDEDVEQFKRLAENNDLAQAAFINLVNKGISPFLPAINSAVEGLGRYYKLISDNLDMNRLLDGDIIVDDINSVERLEQLIKQTGEASKNALSDNEKALQAISSPGLDLIYKKAGEAAEAAKPKVIEFIKSLANPNSVELDPELFTEAGEAAYVANQKIEESAEKTLDPTEELNKKLRERLELLKKEEAMNALAAEMAADQADVVSSRGGGKIESGADTIEAQKKLDEELEAFANSQKTKLQLLEDERKKRLEIIGAYGIEEEKLTDEQKKKALAIEQMYQEQLREYVMTGQQAMADAAITELESFEELRNKKLISEEQYLAKVQELRDQYAPELSDPTVLSDNMQLELEMLQEQLEMKRISYEEYFAAIDEMRRRSGEENEEQFDLFKEITGLEKKEIKDAFKVNSKFSDLTVDQKKSSVKGMMDLGKQLFADNKNVQKGLIIAETARNVVQSVNNSGGVPWGLPAGAAAAALGLSQLSALESATPSGGGSIGGGAQAAPAQQNFQPETTGLQLTDSTSTGSQTIRIELATDSGDDLMVALGRGIDRAKQQGRI